MNGRPDTPLRHGYTLGDLEEMTRIAAGHDRSVAMDVATKRDLAASAIALTLYEAEERPHRGALIQAGWSAIYREAGEIRRGRGYTTALASVADHPDSRVAPGWLRYWRQEQDLLADERVVERIAVWQALPTLSDADRSAVVALAVTGSYSAAAEALGIAAASLRHRLTHARRAFLAIWYGDDTPHRPRTCDIRARRALPDVCGNGHPRLPETTGIRRKIINGRLAEKRFCRMCHRESALRSKRRRAA